MSRDIRKWNIAKILIFGTNSTFVIHQFLCPWETNLWPEITTSDALAFNYFQDLKSPSRLCFQNFLCSPLKGYFAPSNVSCHLSRFSRWRCFNPKAYAVDTWFKICWSWAKTWKNTKQTRKTTTLSVPIPEKWREQVGRRIAVRVDLQLLVLGTRTVKVFRFSPIVCKVLDNQASWKTVPGYF